MATRSRSRRRVLLVDGYESLAEASDTAWDWDWCGRRRRR